MWPDDLTMTRSCLAFLDKFDSCASVIHSLGFNDICRNILASAIGKLHADAFTGDGHLQEIGDIIKNIGATLLFIVAWFEGSIEGGI